MVVINVDNELILRPLEPGDVSTLLDAIRMNSARISSFIQVASMISEPELLIFIDECKRATEELKGLYVGVFTSGTFAGQVRIEIQKSTQCFAGGVTLNIAYWVSSLHTGRALAYRALRALIPYSMDRHWSHLKIARFQADIHHKNLPSQCVVRRLGFCKPIPNTADEIVLDIVAPHTTEVWLLDVDSEINIRLSCSCQKYDHLKLSSHRETPLISSIISIISRLMGEFSDEGPLNSENADMKQVAHQLRQAEEDISSILGKVAPERVISESSSSDTWIDRDDIEGFWKDGDAGVIVAGASVVKGYIQILSKSAEGKQFLSDFELATVSDNEAHFVNRESGKVIKWDKIDKISHSHTLIDGIWKTPRGYSGVFSGHVVTAASVWALKFTRSGVTLMLSPALQIELDTIEINEISWVSTVSKPRRKSKQNIYIDPFRWVRGDADAVNDAVRRMRHEFQLKRVCCLLEFRNIQLSQLLRHFPTQSGILKRATNDTNLCDSPLNEVTDRLAELEKEDMYLKSVVSFVKQLQKMVMNRPIDESIEMLSMSLERIMAIDDTSGAKLHQILSESNR